MTEWPIYQKRLQLSPFPIRPTYEKNGTVSDELHSKEIKEVQMLQELYTFI